ncbi:hypothetical protein [Streptomyces xantholiticus]|uniref:hypothetical protein n=1 Tax=Streptomyces xantholiticus TaxID=68285 RepID=UPI0016776DF1|nr:hypothetical protein [Streptomyces xantholiticus]GGW26033.1 hypothetical protein GCM10010381_07580 [Streptomyces xantholiticus]
MVTAAGCFTGGSGEPAPGKPSSRTVATVGRTDLTTSAGHVSDVSDVVDVVPCAGQDLVLGRPAGRPGRHGDRFDRLFDACNS